MKSSLSHFLQCSADSRVLQKAYSTHGWGESKMRHEGSDQCDSLIVLDETFKKNGGCLHQSDAEYMILIILSLAMQEVTL